MDGGKPVNWTFYIAGEKFTAEYVEGIFTTTSPLLGMTVENLIAKQRPVRVGYFGSKRPASLSSEEMAWSTITRGIRLLSGDARNSFPVVNFGIE